MFKNKHLALLHFIVLIWGFSPILGKLIKLNGILAYQLVFFRILITIATITVYLIVVKQNIRLPRKDVWKLFGVGTIIAFHWFCFYNAINISNVSVTLVAFATGTLFTSIIEPVFYKRKIIRYEIAFGMIIIGAILMIALSQEKMEYNWGIFFGVLAALTSSIFTVFNGLLVQRIESSVIAIYELSGGVVAFSVFLFFYGQFTPAFFALSPQGIAWLVLFAVVGTAFPFVASVNLMRKISPYTVTLTVNLETVYGIILAYIIWRKDEAMTPSFYIGTMIIIATIFGNSLLKNYIKKD